MIAPLVNALTHAVLVLVTGIPTSIVLCLVGRVVWSDFGYVILNLTIFGAIAGVAVSFSWKVVDILREERILPYNMNDFVDKMSVLIPILFLALGVFLPFLSHQRDSFVLKFLGVD